MNQQTYLAIRSGLNLSRRDSALPLFLGQTLALIFAVTAICWFLHQSVIRFAAVPLVALLMFRSFAFMHEAVHGLAARGRGLNHALGVFFGAICLLSYDSWKAAHIAHHKWSGNLDKDPVMAMIKIFPTFPGPLRAVLTLGWKIWVPTLSFLQHTVFWSITVRSTLANPKSASNLLSVVTPILIWGALFFCLPASVSLEIVVPGVFVYLIGTEVINAPHHLGLPYVRGETRIAIWDQHQVARSCVYPRWLARFVVLNFNYHSEHHMFPYVPWYHLDQLHLSVHAELGSQQMMDPSFAWVRRSRTQDLATVFGSPQETQRRAA